MKVTQEYYAKNIPACCCHRTIEEHEDIMLCWGLVSSLEKGKEMNCSGCTENINVTEEK